MELAFLLHAVGCTAPSSDGPSEAAHGAKSAWGSAGLTSWFNSWRRREDNNR